MVYSGIAIVLFMFTRVDLFLFILKTIYSREGVLEIVSMIFIQEIGGYRSWRSATVLIKMQVSSLVKY